MAVRVEWSDPADAARVVDALLTAAAVAAADSRPLLARRYVAMANDVADAVDASRVGPIAPDTYWPDEQRA